MNPQQLLFHFLAVGDTGCKTSAAMQGAKQMDIVAQKNKSRFALLLGDNFYPQGISSPTDPQIKTSFLDIFVNNPVVQYLKTIPFFAVLGNHCYQTRNGDKAQLELSNSTNNEFNPLLDEKDPAKGRIWRMYGDAEKKASKCYAFRVPLTATATPKLEESKKFQQPESSSSTPPPPYVLFVGFDTNAAQYMVRRDYPPILDEFKTNLEWLKKTFADNDDALFKVFFAHQPMYTQGRKHGVVGDCLRCAEYDDSKGNKFPGLNLEQVLAENKVDFYFAGHEHVTQCLKQGNGGIVSVGVGGLVELGWYGGKDDALKRPMDFACDDKYGFASVSVFSSAAAADEKKQQFSVRVDLVDASSGDVMYSVEKSKEQ